MSDQVTAQKVAELLGDLIENIGYPVGMGMRPDPGTLERLATRALAAAVAGERERIAVMVENMNHYEFESYCDNCHSTTIHPQTAADAIRSPETAQAGDATEKENEHG